ncbi:aminotransferases class-v pyridoxal-phosphate attachment site [Lucifera butyrica]|uniref:cysteine desulfurase n=1 Tax=Lucifera butyrica TaxID=1351585 RepID=A0A498R925_9FIRM|nr:aminotransferase class V-fold PLP-dependent enzyme [Lucifera butyrica]VBB07495.1 aminotransferases class-v pyridoxal-phosphate attachment site [Lucifera butyrica]
MIYLDNAATSWPKPETVYQAVDHCLRYMAANPGRGSYTMAREAGRILYETREDLAGLFGVKNATDIAFAYNATDALNMALLGIIGSGDIVVTTAMEHNAVTRPLRYLESRGVKLRIVSCDSQGRLIMEEMRDAAKGAKAIVMTHASNVSGTIMPIAEVAKLAVRENCLMIVDASQTAGREEIQVDDMKIDMLAFSGHKGLFGPQGTAALYLREGLAVRPLRYGGTGSLSESDEQPVFMPDRMESGTPNTPGIAGLGAGIRFIRAVGQANLRKKELALVSALIKGLQEIPDIVVYGPRKVIDRTAVVSFTVRGLDSGEVAHRLDRDFGIACRSGLHCAPWAHRTLGTLETGTIRLSPGYFNTAAEITETIQAVESIARRGEKM